MNLLDIFYTVLIHSLELIFEIIFSGCHQFTHSIPFSLIVLSIAVNLLALPLYTSADKLQNIEFDRQMKMKPWVDHIKKTFRGDERFMMLQTYYRENDYKPTYVLQGAMPLLLQVSFFVAAYNFLSNLPQLSGESFGPIRDFGAPDSMFTIGGFPVNVLPILMTLINVISVGVYSKGKPLKGKIQSYGLALLFLILLYKSLAGLVFYWLFNQLFSLGKNIAGKHVSHSHKSDTRYEADTTTYFAGCVLLTILTGVLIPSNVISSSVAEFIDFGKYNNPDSYVVYALLVFAGAFIVWFGIYYGILRGRARLTMLQIVMTICMFAVIDYFFFGTDLGLLTSLLQYEVRPSFSTGQIVINLVVLMIAVVVVRFLYVRKRPIVTALLSLGAAALIVI